MAGATLPRRVVDLAIAQASDAVTITSADLDAPGPTILWVNAEAERLTGWPADELVGKSPRVLQGPRTDRAVLARLRADLGAGRSFHGATVNYRKDGSAYDVEWRVAPVRDDEGRISHFVAVQRDVTETNRATRALQEAEVRARASETALARAQAVGRIGSFRSAPFPAVGIDASPEFFRILGVSPLPAGASPDQLFDAAVDARDLPRLQAAREHALAAAQGYELDLRIARPDGSLRWVHLRVEVVTDEEGRPRTEGVLQDITERRAAEETFEAFFESTREMLAIVGVDGFYRRVNRAWTRTLGWTLSDLENRLGRELVHPDEREASVSEAARHHDRGEALFTNRFLCKDGGVRTLQWSVTRHTDAGVALLSLRDVTDEHVLRESLAASEKRYRVLFERTAVPKLVWDLETSRVVDANPALLDLWGLTMEQALSSYLDDVVEDSSLPPAEVKRRLLAGDNVRRTCRHRRRDGSFVRVETNINPLQLDRPLAVSVVRDLTEVDLLQERFARAQKMEAVGTLAGGLAHDFNNMLSAILGFTSLAISDLPEDSPIRGDLDQVIAAAERSAQLTHQLLAFSRRQVLEPKVLDLGERVRLSERILKRVLGESIELVVHTPVGLAPVKVDPGQFEQVLMNLVANAKDALPEGGVVSIDTGNVFLDDEYVRRHPDATAGAHVMVEVADTGHGIPSDVLPRLFEPFFTTKGPGKGTGLGLATVFGIVKQSGGHIEIDTGEGRGTAFRIYLPQVAIPYAEAVLLPPSIRRGGTETVLVAEDESLVRDFVKKTLQRHGYRVLEASNGVDALAVAAAHAETIDLLLTDMVMPRMKGRELASRLQPLRPAMAIAFMSGYADQDSGILQDAEAHGARFIAKPISPDALLRVVREALDARPRTAGSLPP